MKKTLLALSLLVLSLLALTISGATAQTTTPATGTDMQPAPLPRKDGRDGMREGGGDRRGPARMAKTPAQRADRHAAKMTKELGLTAEQEAKVESIVLARNQEMKTLRAKYAAGPDRQAGRAEMKAIKTKYNGQLQSALGPDLYARYDKVRDEQHNEAKQAHGAKMKNGKMKLKAKS